MNAYKVLSIDPGCSFSNPPLDRSLTPARSPLARNIATKISRGPASSRSRLILRVVVGLLVCGAAWMQVSGSMSLFGLQSDPKAWGIAVLILGFLMAIGLFARTSALAVAAVSVTSLVSQALAAGGQIQMSPEVQLTLVYGAMAAIVTMVGPGRLTLGRLIRQSVGKRILRRIDALG